ncbi:MAG: hypothetical protein CMJ83_07270 [Planctomycetes bacterium]|nr:hypothetical protein [Planctomycetota bacterium]
MNDSLSQADHTFHVPVMGIGFTIDTPVRLAPLGIDSSISLVNESVIEAARTYHSRQQGRPCSPIPDGAPDARARRITAYLNLVDELVTQEVERLRESSFDDPDGIRRFFELLPDESSKRQEFLAVEAMDPGPGREEARNALRPLLKPGTIGVNIMTKLDGDKDAKGNPRGLHGSDAQEALRGFALSTVAGPMIFSAGTNPALFAYLGDFPDFFPDEQGRTKKTIILKVSDFRSAQIQGRMLARRGLWVSEYRFESGLNCGGHVFPTEGLLTGPILREFADRRTELEGGLFAAYRKGLAARGLTAPEQAPPVKITAQGGIGTADEDSFLRHEYGLDGTGWGTPFLMVPEAVLLDPRSLADLLEAKKEDVQLTWSSPLGVRIWWLKTAPSEEARQQRVAAGRPGSICTGRHLALNADYGSVPLCKASRAYERRRKTELDPKDPDYALLVERVEAPACICVDLCGAFFAVAESEDPPPSAICPGPNIVNFQQERSLHEMVDHIYGRASVLTRQDRPHLFLREVEIYLQVFEEDLSCFGTALQNRTPEQLTRTLDNLDKGLTYYESIVPALSPPARGLLTQGIPVLRRSIAESRRRLEARTASEGPADVEATIRS